jgi:hypothetical protein
MAEMLVEPDALSLNTPFLQTVQARARQETLYHNVMNVILWRFDPPISIYKQTETTLATITDEDYLQALLKIAVQASELAEFLTVLRAQQTQSDAK